MNKTKVIIMTDSSEKTGFGIQSHNIATALANDDFDVSFLGWGFRHDGPLPRANYLLLPCGNHPYGQDALPSYLQQIRPEILFTQSDTRMIDWIPQMLQQIPNKPQWVFYVVVDGNVWDPEGKNIKWPSNWTHTIKQADKVVAMTKFGQKILKENGVESTVIYHGVDTTQFRPISDEVRKQIKKQSGLPEDIFLFGGVFKNIQRKCPEKYLQAFKIFQDKLPDSEKDKVALLLHTPPHPQIGGEFVLPQQAQDYGLHNGKDLLFSPTGLPPQIMPMVYQAMDAFMHLGTMEGFGIPLIEAMSCGLPIIGVDASTMPEILGNTALLSKVPNYVKSHRISFGSYNGVECPIVDPWDVAKKMMILYKDEALRKELGMKATERCIKTFDWSIVKPQWVKYMKDLIITEDDIPEEWAKLYAEVGQ